MQCICCDVPREDHTPEQLAECQSAGANLGSWGLGSATGWDPDY